MSKNILLLAGSALDKEERRLLRVLAFRLGHRDRNIDTYMCISEEIETPQKLYFIPVDDLIGELKKYTELHPRHEEREISLMIKFKKVRDGVLHV